MKESMDSIDKALGIFELDPVEKAIKEHSISIPKPTRLSRPVDTEGDTDKTAQNELFDELDDTVLDFSESNPFGDAGAL